MNYTIHLDKLQFFAHHGWHDAEQLTGTSFEVSVNVHIKIPRPEKLDQTLDYCRIYDMIRDKFSRPVKLLEGLADDILTEIGKSEINVKSADISIMKTNPPIAHFIGNVGVSLSKNF